MQDKYGFVYIWYDCKHKRYYIGCRWGTEDDGYICSSPWMRQGYKHRPHDFKRKILSRIYTNRKDLLTEEHRYLLMIKENELGKRYYNLHNHHFGHWSTEHNTKKTVGEKISKKKKGKRCSVDTEIKSGQRISPSTEFKKGQIPWNKGKKASEETRLKLSLAHKGQRSSSATQFKKGQKPWNAGKQCREETKQKIKEAALKRHSKALFL